MTEPARDVRMRGFAARTTVQEAVAWIDAHSPRGADAEIRFSEHGNFDAAHGRVLARDVHSPIDVPAFDRSAMDGFALRAAETEGAGDYNPIPFHIAGESLPGRPWAGAVPAGSAVRIMTGAPLPPETDAVVPAEFATHTSNLASITAAVTPGKNVGRRGEDVRAGAMLLPAGRVLRPQDVGLLASVGAVSISVVRRPKVRLLVTGNELVAPGQPRGEFQIFEANSSMLRGLVLRDGGEIESQRQLPDDREAIRDALAAPGADVILVSGGSSVGAEDHTPGLVAELGELPIHGIAMRPSSPAGLGRIGTALIALLPGNPVSCLCAYDFFGGRAIRQKGGRGEDWPYPRLSATVERKIVSAVGRVDYVRVRCAAGRVEPLALSGASILSSTTRANGFVIVPEELEGYAPGTLVTVLLYDRV